jgi:hypothetical protein
MRGISWLAENLLAFQKGLCSMELVSQLISHLLTVYGNVRVIFVTLFWQKVFSNLPLKVQPACATKLRKITWHYEHKQACQHIYILPKCFGWFSYYRDLFSSTHVTKEMPFFPHFSYSTAIMARKKLTQLSDHAIKLYCACALLSFHATELRAAPLCETEASSNNGKTNIRLS